MFLSMIKANIIDYYYEFLNKFSRTYTKQILTEALNLLDQLWPYLVVGIIASSAIKVFISKERITTFFSNKYNFFTLLFAAALGVVSPLGSYITIPVSAALFTIGVPLPVLITLIVSSPIINPNLFVLTAGVMGMELAVMRVVAAIALGLTAGFITHTLIKKNYLKPDEILNTNSELLQKWLNTTPTISLKAFFIDLFKMTLFVSRYFFLAIFLAAIIKIFMNPNWIAYVFNQNKFLSALISTGAGVPFYVCGGAAIPVVQALAELGISKGAVLAYFISGPVTKISTLVVLHGTFKMKVVALYLSVGLLGAIILGSLFEMIP